MRRLALGWTAPALAQNTAAPVPVIIDTAFAADDWMAILFLLQHPGADVRAITLTGAGEAHCDPGVRNALNLAALADQPDIPVACGRETPLEGEHTFPDEWRTSVDSMFGIPMPTNEAEPFAGDAVALLQASIAASPQPPVLITLGPLTNIAELFAADPALTAQVARVVIMGGAVNADRERFELAFRNVLNGRPADAPLPEEAVAAVVEGGNTALVRRYFEEGWATPNSPVVDELLAPGYALTGNDPNFVGDIETLKGTIASLHLFMPDATVQVEFVVDAGDTLAVRVMVEGTLSNPDLGELATGEPVALALHSILNVEDGRIVEEWQVVDFSSLLFGFGALKQEVLEQLWTAAG